MSIFQFRTLVSEIYEISLFESYFLQAIKQMNCCHELNHFAFVYYPRRFKFFRGQRQQQSRVPPSGPASFQRGLEADAENNYGWPRPDPSRRPGGGGGGDPAEESMMSSKTRSLLNNLKASTSALEDMSTENEPTTRQSAVRRTSRFVSYEA